MSRLASTTFSAKLRRGLAQHPSSYTRAAKLVFKPFGGNADGKHAKIFRIMGQEFQNKIKAIGSRISEQNLLVFGSQISELGKWQLKVGY